MAFCSVMIVHMKKILILSIVNRKEEYPNDYSLGSLRIVAALCDVQGIFVEIMSFCQDTDDIDEICKNVVDVKPDVVGLPAFIWTWPDVLVIRKKLIDAGIKCVIGGPEVKNRDLESIKKDTLFVYGEGEKICRAIAERDFYTNDIGIIEDYTFDGDVYTYCGKGTMHKTALLSDSFLLNVHGYRINTGFMWYETSRGCPYRCGYCGHRLRENMILFDLNFIEEEIKNIGKYHIDRIFIVDPIMGGTPENGKVVLRLMNKYAPDTSIIAYLRPEYLDDEYIDILSITNVEEIRIGLQTLTETVPKWIRFNDMKKVCEMLPKLSKNGVPWRAELIIGLPGDNVVGFENSMKKVIEVMRPTYLYVYHLSVLKGTPMWGLVDSLEKEWIKVSEDGVSAYSCYSYSHEELLEMLSLGQKVTHYYNHNVQTMGRKKYNMTKSFEETKGEK